MIWHNFLSMESIKYLMTILIRFIDRLADYWLPSRPQGDLWPGFTRQLRHSGADNPGYLVSITPIDDDQYLLANFRQIFLFNSQTNSVEPMTVDAPGVFVPTGLFYSKMNRLLYEANYLGNNILIWALDIPHRNLSFVAEIKSQNTVSPETVFVNDNGEILVSANTDGNQLTAFDLKQSHYPEIWSTEVGFVHGLCIIGYKIYTTSLQDRQLLEVDLQTGKILRRVGSLGWNTSKLEFLWPTGAYPYSDHELIVADAQTGIIGLIDINSMTVKRHFGGNGPGFRYLNMPYTAIRNGDSILIISTFQERILVGDTRFRFSKSLYWRSGHDWSYMKARQKSLPMLGVGWTGYVHRDGPIVRFLGADYFAGYGMVYPVIGDHPVIRMPLIPSTFNPTAESYFLQVAKLEQGFILFAAENVDAYYIKSIKGRSSSITYTFKFTILQDSWVIQNEIYSPNGKPDFSNVIRSFDEAIVAAEKVRLSNGLIREQDLCQIVLAQGGDCSISISFKTRAGQEFYAQYKGLMKDPNHVTIDEVRRIAIQYYKQIADESYANLDEIALVEMLTGYSL
jgi:hypothetical protein